MSLTITPGYDFQTTEVPTRATLQQCVLGMSITGIPQSMIDSTLVSQMYTTSTSVSLPGEGWIDYDQHGRLWVKSRWGHVCLHRGNWGGWETRRYPCMDVIDTYTFPFNNVAPVGQLRTVVAGNTTESNVAYRAGTSIGIWRFKNCESAVSGALVRLVGRGGWMGEVLSSNRSIMPDYQVRQGTGVQDQAATPFPASDASATTKARKGGLLLRQNGNGAATVRATAWYFGMELMED